MYANILMGTTTQLIAVVSHPATKLEFLKNLHRIVYASWFSAKAQINYIHIERSKINMAAVIMVLEKKALL